MLAMASAPMAIGWEVIKSLMLFFQLEMKVTFINVSMNKVDSLGMVLLSSTIMMFVTPFLPEGRIGPRY